MSKSESVSVIEAIKRGQWDFEPATVDREAYDSTRAMPGSEEKLGLLAQRISEGLPLWHPDDRRCYDDSEEALH